MLEDELLHAETFRDRISTVTESGKRRWIYALEPKGRYKRVRDVLAWGYLALFFALPFIKINGHPVFLLNILDSKIILFGKIFWPQDFFIFALAMIAAIIFVVLFTVIYGRLFCGWACPQTIFMEFVFRKIEWLVEGSPGRQHALNGGPWTGEKILKKSLKHALFLAFSFLIAHTFLAYILGVDGILQLMREPLAGHIGLVVGLVIFTLLFYSVFAFVREIVCTTICPYGRLQSVMFDKDTMQIAYDYKRGEPRGRFKKGEARTLGDCVDCKKCVMVCPTGIDIRDGVQMDCVACTNCIDACDEVMDKLAMPRGLIRYASENQIEHGTKFHFTPRIKAYSVVLVILVGVMTFMIATRKSVDTYVTRVKGQLYQETEPGMVSNLFEAKVLNKTMRDITAELRLEEIDGGSIRLIGAQQLVLKQESINHATFFADIPRSSLDGRTTNIRIGVYADGELLQTVKTKFLGPF
jgi:cytochrome c oxidase accessory protein FixG